MDLWLSAHVTCAPRARLRQSFSRMLMSQKHNMFFNGSKTCVPLLYATACVLSGLLSIHRIGYCCRDLSSENAVILLSTRTLKIIDLGACKRMPVNELGMVLPFGPGVPFGKPSYMAPEVRKCVCALFYGCCGNYHGGGCMFLRSCDFSMCEKDGRCCMRGARRRPSGWSCANCTRVRQ